MLVPQLGFEPTFPALEAWIANHWRAREIPVVIFKAMSIEINSKRYLIYPCSKQRGKSPHLFVFLCLGLQSFLECTFFRPYYTPGIGVQTTLLRLCLEWCGTQEQPLALQDL